MLVSLSQNQLTVGLSLALLPVCGLWPVADAAVFVEPEAGAAGVLLGRSVDAGVENVTDAGVRVGIKAVQTRAEVTWAFGRLCRKKF